MKKYIIILTLILIVPTASADTEFELSPLLPVQTQKETTVKEEVKVKTSEITENTQNIKEKVSSEIKNGAEEISEKTKNNIKKNKKKIKEKTKKIKKEKKDKKKEKSKEEIAETPKSEEEIKPEEDVLQENRQTEEVEQQKRKDTEHTVEYSQDEEFKFKHELLKIYENKYEENNRDVENILKLARIHLDLGQRAIAKSYYMQLYNTYPNSPRIQFEMGKFYYECKQYNAALEFFKLSLASGYLKNIEVNEYTRKTYAKLGDEENEALYEKIIEHLNGNSQTGE